MTDETRARFLAAIAKKIPAERVIEVHLFSAIKQGGMESGVAVLAVERDIPVSIDVDGGYVPEKDVAEAAALESPAALAVHDQLADESAFVTDEVVSEGGVSATGSDASDASEITATDDGAIAEAVEPEEAMPVVRAPASRYTVYSARYRHTLKGMDRGKWEVSVTDEADAPLLTIDAVVRGVQRRSGDADEIVRLSGDEFRALLPETTAAA